MYSITISGTQVLDSAVLHCSLCETDDNGRTEVLFSVQCTAEDSAPDLSAYSLERFLDQVVVGMSRALAVRWTGLDGPGE